MSHTASEKDLTSVKRASIEAARQMARQRPSLDDLVDQGEIDEPVPHGQFLELLALMMQLKRERERRNLSLTDLSEHSGLTRSAISRLENGWNTNPTLDTIFRYAMALGMHVKFSAEVAANPGE
jgi:DNA-binding XRE family transcriptional regulator